MSARESVFAPLRHKAFAALWIGFTTAAMGQSMQALGAQWFLLSTPGGEDLAPFVQACVTLPLALLALPAGVLADGFDRRRLLLGTQLAVLSGTVLLAILASTGTLTPPLILALTALMACAWGLTFTPMQSLVPDLVAAPRIVPASSLFSISSNTARMTGPAAAGLTIAALGLSAAFAIQAALTLVFVVALLRWNGRTDSGARRERFMSAARSGVRYARHSPQVLKIMLRCFWFTGSIMALLSMLPLLAQDRGAGPVELGLLFAAQGLGAISGALLLPSVETRLGPNATIGTAFVGAAFVLASVSVTSSLIVTGLLMAAAGWFWATALTTMTAALQIYLPAWVRARGLAVVAVAGFGGQALGALLSGWAAIHVSLVLILWIGAASLACGALLALWWPLRDLGELDRTPSTGWVDPELAVDVGQAPGVVVVSIVYWVDTAAESAFIERILDLRRVRLRNGATRWRLLKDAEGDNRFVEEYTVGSWEEYGQQQTHRLVISDRAVETAVHALSSTRTPAHHYFRIAP